ncbi:MAG TPA: hypothetical protein VKA06_00505, partial [Spirochaetia bacterium]|nr:hypothetical protein [Spirochaetia bacterium]
RRGTATKDLEPARLVAEVAGLPWQLIDLDDPDAGDESELFRLKRGMNSLRMSFILPFFRRLIDDFGPDLTYFTGDSGLALRSLLPRRRPRDAKEFVDAVFAARGRYHRHPVYHPDTACRIAGVSRDDFDRWLIEEITVGRSEMGWAELFLWFTLEGYGRRWHYEGMDRNRHFFWLAAPLEATPVLDLVSRVHDSKKKDFSFYGAVLRELDPELGNIPKAGQRFAPGSLPQRARGRLTTLYQSLPTPLVQRLREVRGKGLQPVAPDTFPLGQLRQRWESSPTSRAHFDLSSLLDGCDTERCYSAADSLLSFWEFVDGIR